MSMCYQSTDAPSSDKPPRPPTNVTPGPRDPSIPVGAPASKPIYRPTSESTSPLKPFVEQKKVHFQLDTPNKEAQFSEPKGFYDVLYQFFVLLAELRSGVQSLVTLLLAATIFVALLALGQYCWKENKMQEPASRMKSFALREVIHNDLGDIGNLAVDGLKLHSQATCLQGDSVEQMRDALRLQLRDIPEKARENIVLRAVIEGMDTSSTAQDTAPDAMDSGKVFSYLAYWSTTYNENSLLMPTRYSTCVMAAGVDIKVGEVVAGFETTQHPVKVGTKDCDCGFFTCSRCSAYEKVETKRPIFKRHQLRLKDQINLHRWMVKQAVDRAESLTHTTTNLATKWNRETKKGHDEIESIAWKRPSDDTFVGNDFNKGQTSPLGDISSGGKMDQATV